MATANVMSEALMTATRRFGRMTRQITVAQFAPRLRAASVSVRMSMARRPASMERKVYGSTKTV